MRGQTTLIGFLAFLFITGVVAISANARYAATSSTAGKLERGPDKLDMRLVESGVTRAAYPAGNWSSRVEVRPDGTLRTLSGTRVQVAQGPTGALIGGTCSYRDVPGTATIVRVAKTPASAEQARTAGGPGYEGFEVSFEFAPSQPIAEPQVRNFTQSTHPLRLTNSWYPGPRYIEKYHLSQGRKVPALLKVRTSGACTPMLFSFPGIELADYFERAQ
jgi:hypothetical protein